MATRIPLFRRGDMLLPATQEGIELLRRLEINKAYAADVVQLRHLGLHKKAFAYVKLAFDYWQPENFLTTAERKTVGKLGKFLVDSGLDQDTVRALCKEFLGHLNESRRGLEVHRDIEAFREFITVEAGFYRTVITPAGPRREAKSWAYKNMGEEEFQRLFTAIRGACWDLILSQTFNTIEEADAVAEQLMEFD